MKEILISKENLKLTQLPYISGSSSLLITDEVKSNFRLQKILMISRVPTFTYKIYDISGTKTVNFPRGSSYEEAWVIEGTPHKNPPQSYDSYEEKIILSWLSCICGEHLRLSESLCQALEDEEVASGFYRSYGEDSLKTLKKYYSKIIQDSDYVKLPWTGKYGKLYTANRYTVLEFLKDLVLYKAKINLSPEIIGEYKRISRKVLDSAIPIDNWYKVVGITGNISRANVNLSCIGKVKLEIPENTVGVPSGEMICEAFRSINIIADGILNTRKLGIKVSNKKFIRKLKLSGILLPDSFLYSDEYLVDLGELPICKIGGGGVSSFSLATAELQVYTKKLLYEYIKRLLYSKTKIISEVDPKKEFLAKLGIYDGIYFYKKNPKVTPVSREYEASEILVKFHGLPKDPTIQLFRVIKTGSSSNSYINNFLSSYKYLESKSPEELEELYIRAEKDLKASVSRLRDLKFRLIIRKTLRFSDKYKPSIEKSLVPVSGVLVSWSIKKNKIKV